MQLLEKTSIVKNDQTIYSGASAQRALARRVANKYTEYMWYVYVLRSEIDGNKYIGVTMDITRRLGEHNSGKNTSTKYRRPFKLDFYFSFESKYEAFEAERKFKRSHGALERARQKFGIIPG